MAESIQIEYNPAPPSTLRLVLSGFFMGAADVVPGVSGGTVAFILGIYEDLLQAIRQLDFGLLRLVLQGKIRQAITTGPWRFLIALGSGMLLAILTISHSLVWALEHFPELIWAFFFGLVLASILVVSKRMKRWNVANVLLAISGAAVAYLLVGLVPVETPTTPWFLFLSGALAITAMILPGLSGAFILLILGKYQFLLEAVVNGEWLPLVIVAAGAGAGLLSFARLLHWLFKHYHDLTVAVLIGFVAGALRRVWPWKEVAPVEPGSHTAGEFLLQTNVFPSEFTLEVGAALVFMVLGIGLVLLLDHFGKNKKVQAQISG